MTSEPPQQSIKFAPFTSFVDSAFFHELSARKLNDIKLDESQIPVLGSYSLGQPSSSFASFSVSKSSFFTDNYEPYQYTSPPSYVAHGSVLDLNTIESFKSHDRSAMIKEGLKSTVNAIISGEALQDPSLLSTFQILMYSDLKKFNFYYWFAFPVAMVDWTSDNEFSPFTVTPELHSTIEEWRKANAPSQWGFFLLKQNKADSSSSQSWSVACLKEYNELFSSSDEPTCEYYLAFADPSPHELIPGWPLRPLLLLAYYYKLFDKYPKLKVLAYRGGKVNNGSYIIPHVSVASNGNEMLEKLFKQEGFSYSEIKATGWERIPTTRKLGPKHTNLGALIDPVQLADQAVDLNLKLMKWRIAPDLDLDVIKNSKCLLLGAGTLGSYIARALMGWGVRKITFVDNGTVSYSNPVRQPLYNFEDCKAGGKPKAECAANALKVIYPSMEAEGYQLEIPMAGHAIRDEESQKRDYDNLEKLIREHDVVFLLMDSRESRWLPTVMCSSLSKIVINAALGFDSFVVMRHGISSSSSSSSSVDNNNNNDEDDKNSPHLGCYFCNDVVAPLDSLSNRTLDQMCTVTRPGVAMLASANAVELLVSLLQHPMKGLAPPPPTPNNNNNSNEEEQIQSKEAAAKAAFGWTIPHQIRGFLSSFDNIKVTGPAYNLCSACSLPIRKEWELRGWEFVKDALNNPKYLEELSGLSEIQKLTEEMAIGDGDEDDWALSD